MRIQYIRTGLLTTAAIIVILNLFGGTLMSAILLLGHDSEIWLRVISFVHIVGSFLLFVLWKQKICPVFHTAKAPLYLVFSAFYSSLLMFSVKQDELISEGYGDVEYDSHGAYLDGAPSVYTHILSYPYEHYLFPWLVVSSVLFIWFWDDIKSDMCDKWCD